LGQHSEKEAASTEKQQGHEKTLDLHLLHSSLLCSATIDGNRRASTTDYPSNLQLSENFRVGFTSAPA
jgi:hypothetical protein